MTARRTLVTLQKGYNLILTTSAFTAGRYWEQGGANGNQDLVFSNIGPNSQVVIPSKTYDRSFILESTTGEIQYSQEIDTTQWDSNYEESIIPNVPFVIPTLGDYVLITDTSDNGELKKILVQDLLDLVSGGGVSSAANSHPIAQLSHSLNVGDVVRLTGMGAYVKADANSPTGAECIGIVSDVEDADNFTLITDGKIDGLSGLVVGDTYFLHPTIPGAITNIDPDPNLYVRKALLVADSETSGFLMNYPGEYYF